MFVNVFASGVKTVFLVIDFFPQRADQGLAAECMRYTGGHDEADHWRFPGLSGFNQRVRDYVGN